MATSDEDSKQSIESVHKHLSHLSYQIECTRLLQQIEGDLRELRALASKARVLNDGEDGYMVPQQIGDGEFFEIHNDERIARHLAVKRFTDIEAEFDRLTGFLPEYSGNLIDLAIELGHFRTNAREEARKSVGRSLYALSFSGYMLDRFKNKSIRWLLADFDERKRIVNNQFPKEI